MLKILAILLALAQSGAKPIPATDVKADEIEATVKLEIAKPTTDMPIRTMDAGGYNVGVGVVHRLKGAKSRVALHDKVTEVY